MTMRLLPPRTMLEVFESLPEGTLCQLINNQLVMAPSPLIWHQSISNIISNQLTNFVLLKKSGIVLVAPIDVFFDKHNVLQPDILFISNENMGIIIDDKIKGAPDFIVEILSKSTGKYDLNQKKLIYEKFGVKEYWIVNPETKEVIGYTLKDKKFELLKTKPAIINSKLLGVKIVF